MSSNNKSVARSINTPLFLILLANSMLWVTSGFGKLTGGVFVPSLNKTLAVFASNNPNIWFVDFLNQVAIPNYILFGTFTMWGELFSGISVALAVLYFLFNKKANNVVLSLLAAGLTAGAFLNLIFWLAAGWTSPSTYSLNILMFVVEAVGIFVVLKFFRTS